MQTISQVKWNSIRILEGLYILYL